MELTSENVYIVNGFSFHDDLKAIAFESHKVTENIVYLTHGKTDKSEDRINACICMINYTSVYIRIYICYIYTVWNTYIVVYTKHRVFFFLKVKVAVTELDSL